MEKHYMRKLFKRSPTGRRITQVESGENRPSSARLSYGTSINYPEPVLTINVGDDYYLQLSKSAFEEIVGFF